MLGWIQHQNNCAFFRQNDLTEKFKCPPCKSLAEQSLDSVLIDAVKRELELRSPLLKSFLPHHFDEKMHNCFDWLKPVFSEIF
jgi:hypothetical protein